MQQLTVSRKSSILNVCTAAIDKQHIEVMTRTKLVGIHLNDKLSFKQHTVVRFAALVDNFLNLKGKKTTHSLVYPFLKIYNHKKEPYE